ncbi:MAG TPA: aspartate kinase, partial [Chitinophagaceae bacterium]|nr:aspartate kinase [Chitinophagaceae bacterium]
MKVMKFGGTSVGKPERMQQVVSLIQKNTEPVIVVLSAIAGTTNILTEISEEIAHGDRISAKQKIDLLEKKYRQFIKALLSQSASLEKANTILAEHFEFLNIILKISFSEALSKDILAQGELLSTKLFSV